MTSEKYFDKFNIMIIGDEKVGKTSILERYFDKKFIDDRRQTLGMECFEKDKYIDNKKLLIKIWDTAGQEKFSSVARSFYQRAHGIIVACSLDNKGSFYNLKNWLKNIRENSADDSIQLIIIANKCDLIEEREVTNSDLENLARDLNVAYYETSAKDNINIDEAFNNIIEKVYNNVYQKYSSKGFQLNSNSSVLTNRDKGNCCNK